MGFGLSQVLPVIVQCVAARPGSLLIVEQPELHLHPRAQAELGNLFTAIAQKGVHCFIETHSEHLLLRLQKQIAKTTVGAVDASVPGQMLLPSQIAVYFVNRKKKSTATQIQIGPYGDLLNTPEGFEDFFSDDMLETAERMQARFGVRSRKNR
jgi:predicted ATPase